MLKQTPPQPPPPASFDLSSGRKPESPLEKVTQLWRMTKSWQGKSKERDPIVESVNGEGEEQAPFFYRSAFCKHQYAKKEVPASLMLHQLATEETKRFESVFQE